MTVPESCERNIEDVVEKLRSVKRGGVKCTLLLGAGCSISAGIPGAKTIVEDIKAKYPQAYQRAQHASSQTEPGYSACMEALDEGERGALFNSYFRDAKINWAHIAIAQLMKEGYIDRIVTTNFDNVLVRACALVGLFPAVYDLTHTGEKLPFDELPSGSILYMHGQGSGFSLKNTAAEVQKQVSHLKPCFNFGAGGRTWIVVGYSGENDPVFNTHLRGVTKFRHSLYWVGYKNELPAQIVCDALFTGTKDAFRIKGYDADNFFCRLGQQLECFPPQFVRKPFSYLDDLLQSLTLYPLPDYGPVLNVPVVTNETIQWVKSTIEPQYTQHLETTLFVMAGQWEAIIAKWVVADEIGKVLLAEASYGAYLEHGNDFLRKAEQQTGDSAIALYQQGISQYQEAIRIKEDGQSAFYNLGKAYHGLAALQGHQQSSESYEQSKLNYQKAYELMPDDYDTWVGLGSVLCEESLHQNDPNTENVLRQATDLLNKAFEVRQDDPAVLLSLGTLNEEKSNHCTGSNKELYLNMAETFYLRAIHLSPKLYLAWYNLGNIYLQSAKLMHVQQIIVLCRQAIAAYKSSLEINPYRYEPHRNWASALSEQAYHTLEPERSVLLLEAAEHHQIVTERVPDREGAWADWGSVLMDLSRYASVENAKDFQEQAGQKLQRAESLKEGSASYNMACLSALRNDIPACQNWLEKAFQFGSLPSWRVTAHDWPFNHVRLETWFQRFMQKAYPRETP